MKRVGSTIYHQCRRGVSFGELIPHPEGYLYAQGRYPTKLRPDDLPEWYISGYLRSQIVYISARGVKDMVYVPTYNNHLDKDDLLYVSYDKPIEPDHESRSGKWLHGYAHILYGGIVFEYVNAVAKYSNYDVRPILREINRKRQWYQENYGQ